MACCLAAALGPDGLDVDGLARAYIDWATIAFDIGTLTRAAIGGLAAGDRDAARRAWDVSGHDAAPNGSLMRTAPIGVRFATDPVARRAAAFDDSALTHFDPRCQLACAAFDAAIAAGVAGATDPRELVRAAADELPAASITLIDRLPEDLTGWVIEARAALARDLDAALADDPELRDQGGERLDLHGHMGFVRIAFRLAFWELVHADGYQDGVIDVVNRGGDADTNGAIAGALLGAYHGIHAIPPAWSRRVLDAVPEGAPALRVELHPRVLVAAIDRWGY